MNTRQALLDIYRDAIKAGMTIEEVQAEINSFQNIVQHTQPAAAPLASQSVPRRRRILPMVLMTLGSVMVINAVWPIVYYFIVVAPQLNKHNLQAPVPQENVLAAQIAEESRTPLVHAQTGELVRPHPKPVVVSNSLDYTNLANWFTDSTMIESTVSEELSSYTLDIPSLKIEDAQIVIGGTDLNSSLIQYPGTAEPGDLGAPVIFGHSVLRQFYKPDISNPQRYKSIFSKIMTLKKGDEILITHEGVKYTYVVEEKHDVQPEDDFILAQKHSERELKLVTCVPEGTYLRRGVVVAKLVKVE